MDIALRLLFPRDLHKQASAFLGASGETIRDWRRGRYQPPQWALDKIAAALRSRAAEMLAAADAIEKEKGRG